MPGPPSSGWRALTTPTWIVGHLLALSAVVAFTQFGFWQLRRHDQRMERNAAIEARLAGPATTLAEALAAADAARERGEGDAVDPLEYRPVRLEGVFDPSGEVLKRPVVRDGSPGFHVVTPLVLPGGDAVFVDRGWVPQAFDRVPVEAAAPPAGAVEVVGWVFPSESPPTGAFAALAPRDPPSGRLTQVAYVDVERLADQVAYPLLDVLVVESRPAADAASSPWPVPPPTPTVSLGPHLGYALQWFAFVVVTVVGYVALLRRRAAEAAVASIAASSER